MNRFQRLYNCKDEELLPIAQFTLFSLKRDLAEISAIYKTMNNEYVEQTEDVCNAVLNLLEPEAEMLAKRQMNDQMKAHLINLSTQMDYLEGFLRLAKKAHGFTSTSFGISNLRKASNKSDFEGIVANFKLVING